MMIVKKIRKTIFISVGLIVSTAFFSCDATYAPPIKVVHGSMPETRGKGGGAVQGSYGMYNVANVALTLGLIDKLDLIIGVDGEISGDDSEAFLIGNAGVRYQLVDKKILRVAISGGFGLGTGGVRENQGGFGDRLAAGGYGDINFGARISKHFGIYQSNRYMLAWARNVPITNWGHHVLGFEIDWTRFFFTSIEGGVAYYRNSSDRLGGGVGSVSVGYRWGKGN